MTTVLIHPDYIILIKMKATLGVVTLGLLLKTIWCIAPFHVSTSLAPEGTLLSYLVHGTADLTGDIFYELKSEGFYSSKVYEGYVHRPVAELAAAGHIQLNFTLAGSLHVEYKTQFNLLKLKIGIQHFLSTRYFDDACFMMFGRFEGLSFNHDLRTNLIQCSNNLLDDFTRLTPF